VLEGAAGEPALAQLRADLAEQRLHGLRNFAGLLAERGELKPGLTVDKARDLIWTLCAQGNFDALVTARGWSHEDYREWLSEALASALLPAKT
jgi:hypothetical protein